MTASRPIMLGYIIWHYWLIGAKGNGKEEVQEIWALVKLITFDRKKNHLSQWGHYAYTRWQDRQIPFLFFLVRHTANPYSDLIADGSEESSCYQGNCDGWFWLFSDTSGKRNPQLKNCLYQTGLQPCWGGAFSWLVWEGTAHWGQCHPWAGGLGCGRKGTEQVLKQASKQHSSIFSASAPAFRLLFELLASLHDTLWPASQRNPFLPEWLWGFITTKGNSLGQLPIVFTSSWSTSWMSKSYDNESQMQREPPIWTPFPR